MILIKTISDVAIPYFQLGTSLGAFGMQQYQLEGGLSSENSTFIGQSSYNSGNGYRDNSGYKHWNFNGKYIHKLRDKSVLNVNLNYSNSPQADDPGGVNLETRNADPKAARDRNLQFAAGEELSQIKGSLSYVKKFKKDSEISFYGFGAMREFLGYLPFSFGGVVDLGRKYFGLGGHYTTKQILSNSVNTFQLGFDFASQDDSRMRFLNIDGSRGDLVVDQNEKFSGFGVYLLDYLDFGDWLISGGIRWDRNDVELVDNIVSPISIPMESGFNSINPSLGISFSLSEGHNIFGNYSRSFETPSLSELFSDPNGGSGLNKDLKPQKANSFELGLRGRGAHRWTYEAVLYRINTTDDLVPFELEQQIGVTYYRNAGKTIRKGLELSASYLLSDFLSLSSTYTYSDFEYDEFDTANGDFSGNALPGIPKHYGNIALKSADSQLFIYKMEARLVGSIFGADNNVISTQSYALVSVQVGYRFESGTAKINPFLGVNNLFNTDYDDNIRINAFGGRHFEAGPPIHLFGGVKVRF